MASSGVFPDTFLNFKWRVCAITLTSHEKDKLFALFAPSEKTSDKNIKRSLHDQTDTDDTIGSIASNDVTNFSDVFTDIDDDNKSKFSDESFPSLDSKITLGSIDSKNSKLSMMDE